jgi:hypothetical protein
LSYDIDPQEGHVRIVGTGTVSMPSMIAVVERAAADPRFRSRFTVVFDLREAQYTAELSDGDALAAVLKEKRTDFQNRFALVVPESLHVLARLYCVLAGMGGFDKIRCFTDLREAREWCRTAREPPGSSAEPGGGRPDTKGRQ